MTFYSAHQQPSPPKHTIIVEISGGCYVELHSDLDLTDCAIEILDWDNFNYLGGEQWEDGAEEMDQQSRDEAKEYSRLCKLVAEWNAKGGI